MTWPEVRFQNDVQRAFRTHFRGALICGLLCVAVSAAVWWRHGFRLDTLIVAIGGLFLLWVARGLRRIAAPSSIDGSGIYRTGLGACVSVAEYPLLVRRRGPDIDQRTQGTHELLLVDRSGYFALNLAAEPGQADHRAIASNVDDEDWRLLHVLELGRFGAGRDVPVCEALRRHGARAVELPRAVVGT